MKIEDIDNLTNSIVEIYKENCIEREIETTVLDVAWFRNLVRKEILNWFLMYEEINISKEYMKGDS